MRLLVCNIVPNDLVVSLNAPQAANNFCFNLLDSNCFDYAHSIIPISYYHNGIKNEGNVEYFQGLPGCNRWFRTLYFLYANLKCALKSSKANHIWFYNICKANFICFMILRFILRKKVYVILLDYTPTSNKLNIEYYFPLLYQKSLGVISLSQRTSIKHRNIQYKAGIIPSPCINKVKPMAQCGNLKFLFSGNLGAHTGFPLALEVFKELPTCELYISGNGKVDVEVLKSYPNIHYLGYLSYEDYLNLYNKVDVCLSLRNPEYEENNNNFPSKILEYFCYRKIVLSTINYPELRDFHFLHCNYSKMDIKDMIAKLQSFSKNELSRYQDNVKALQQNFSEESWRKCFELIENYR